MTNDSKLNSEFFATTTQLYVRLRRVSGRVIDVVHMSENLDYARHIVSMAMAINDVEVQRYAIHLNELIDPISFEEPVQEVTAFEENQPIQMEEPIESTADEIFKAEVSHHYIGALR